MVKEDLPKSVVKIALSILAFLLVTGLSFAISDRVSLGDVVDSHAGRITRLEARQETVYTTLDKIDSKLDKIIDCQAAMQAGRPC